MNPESQTKNFRGFVMSKKRKKHGYAEHLRQLGKHSAGRLMAAWFAGSRQTNRSCKTLSTPICPGDACRGTDRGQFNMIGQIVHTYPSQSVFPMGLAWTTNCRKLQEYCYKDYREERQILPKKHLTPYHPRYLKQKNSPTSHSRSRFSSPFVQSSSRSEVPTTEIISLTSR